MGRNAGADPAIRKDWESYISTWNLPDSGVSVSPQSVLDIQNAGRNTTSLYQILTPFQVTSIRCTGASEGDHLEIETLAQNRNIVYRQPNALHHAQYQARNHHFHNYFELLLVLDGTIKQTIEGKEFLYPVGSGCLINRSLVHLEDYTGPAEAVFIGLSTEFIQQLFRSTETAFFEEECAFAVSDIFRFVTNDLQSPGTKAYLDFLPRHQGRQAVQTVRELCASIRSIIRHPGFGSTHQLYGQLSALLCALSDPAMFQCSEVRLDRNSDTVLFSRIRYLLESSHGRMGRGELARQLNYSGDYISRIVKKYTGQCLYDFSMSFCLDQVAFELVHSGSSVSEIVQRLGLSNRTHFYKLFKERYGATPNEYRRLRVGDPV